MTVPLRELFEALVPLRVQHDRRADDQLITPWVLTRYMIVGLYVGFATVGSFAYWYVLMYLPDLQWCHLAPLERRGTFGADAGARSAGRARWMLVSEEEGGEIDVSAARCTVMETREIKARGDADEEEWDILGESAA